MRERFPAGCQESDPTSIPSLRPNTSLMSESDTGPDIAMLKVFRGRKTQLRTPEVLAVLCVGPSEDPSHVWLQLAIHLSGFSTICKQGKRVVWKPNLADSVFFTHQEIKSRKHSATRLNSSSTDCREKGILWELQIVIRWLHTKTEQWACYLYYAC